MSKCLVPSRFGISWIENSLVPFRNNLALIHRNIYQHFFPPGTHLKTLQGLATFKGQAVDPTLSLHQSTEHAMVTWDGNRLASPHRTGFIPDAQSMSSQCV